MKKRIVAAFMAAVMTVTSLPVNTFSAIAAEDTQDVILEENSGATSAGESTGETAGETENSQEKSAENPAQGQDISLEILDQEVVSEEAVPEKAARQAQGQQSLDNGQASEVTEDAVSLDTQTLDNVIIPDADQITVIASVDELYDVVISQPGDAVWFRFAAPEAGEYYFFSEWDASAGEDEPDTCGALYDATGSLLEENDDDMDSQFGITYPLEQGETYFLKAYMWDDETGSFLVGVKEAEKKRSPIAITEILNFKTVYPAGISGSVDAQAVLSYGDGETETVYLYESDSNGNTLEASVLDTDLFLGEALPEREYTVRFQCGNAYKNVEIQVVPVAEYLQSEHVTVLTMEQAQTVEGGSRNCTYDFAFTAPAQGKYSFSFTSTDGWLTLYDEQGNGLDGSNSVCAAALEEGQTILIRAELYAEAGEAGVLSAQMRVEVKDITLEVPEQVVYSENLYANIVVTFSYTDETLSSQTVDFEKGYRDTYGNSANVRIKGTEGENTGAKTVTASCGGITKTAPMEVISRLDSDMEFGTMQIPSQLTASLAIPDTETAYLKLVPEAAGDYKIQVPEGCWTFDVVDAGENYLLRYAASGGIVSLEAGKEYLLVLRGYAGTYEVAVSPVKSVTGLTVSAPEKLTNWYDWTQNVTVTLTYSDGSEETLTGLFGSTADGRNLKRLIHNDETGEETDNIWGEFAYGTYTVIVSCGGQSGEVKVKYTSPEEAAMQLSSGENRLTEETVPAGYAKFTLPEAGTYSFRGSNGSVYLLEGGRYVPFIYTGEAGDVLVFSVVFDDEAEVILNIEKTPVLQLGENTLENLTEDGRYYSFTTDAEASGYCFTTDGVYASIYKNDETYVSSISGERSAFVLESSATYNVVVHPSYDGQTEGALTIEKVPQIQELDVSVAYESYWSRIDCFDDSDIIFTWKYQDGSQGEVRGWNKDEYGYGLTEGWLSGPDESSYNLETAGTYTYKGMFGGQPVVFNVTVLEPDASVIPQIASGKTLEIAPYGKEIFSVAVEQDGLYRLAADDCWIYVFDGESLESVNSFYNQGSLVLNGGQTYYLRVTNEYGETKQFSMQSGVKAESIELLQTVSSYPAGIPYDPIWGMKANVTYSDGSVQAVGELAGLAEDDSKNPVTAVVKDENGEVIPNTYASEGLEEGTYTVELSLAGAAASYDLTVGGRDAFFTESLHTGTIEFALDGMNFYTLQTDDSSWYLNFSVRVNRYVTDLTSETPAVNGSYSAADTWDFMEADKTYYVVFWASPGEEREPAERGTVEITRPLSVTGLTLKDGRTEFNYGETGIIDNYTVTAEYSDGSSADFGPGAESVSDAYGNSVYAELLDAQGQQVPEYQILEPGTYTVQIHFGGQTLSYEVTIQPREAVLLTEGEQTLSIASGTSGLYLLPSDMEKVHISLGEGADVTYQAGPKESPSRYSGSGSDIYIKQGEGETVCLLIWNNSDTQQFTAVLSGVKELTTEAFRVPKTAVQAWGEIFLDWVLLQKTYAGEAPVEEHYSSAMTEDGYYYQAKYFRNGQEVNYPEAEPGSCTMELWQYWGNWPEKLIGDYELTLLDREAASEAVQEGTENKKQAEAGSLYDFSFVPEQEDSYQLTFGREVELFWQEENQDTYSSFNGDSVSIDMTAGTKMFFCFRSEEAGEITFSVQSADDEEDVQKNLKDAVVEEIPDQTETGVEVCPPLYVELEGELLEEGTDYTVVYENCVEPGTATAVITGIGRYTGELRIPYTILPGTIYSGYLSALDLAEGVTQKPEEDHGAVWYRWTPSRTGIFLLYGTGEMDGIGLFREQSVDGTLVSAKDETVSLGEQGNLLGYRVSDTSTAYYIRLLAGAESVLVSSPERLYTETDSTQSTASGSAAWLFTPDVSGTYGFTAAQGGLLYVYSEEMALQDIVSLAETEEGQGTYQGTVNNLVNGIEYLILWSGEASSQTLKAEKTPDEMYTALVEGENQVYIPAGDTVVYRLPAGEGKRYVRTKDGIALNLSVGTEEEPGLYEKSGENAIAYKGAEAEYLLTVENTSDTGVTRLWTGQAPKAATTLSSDLVPEAVLSGWTEQAAAFAELYTEYTGGAEVESTWSHRLGDGEDDFGYSWSLEIEGNEAGEATCLIKQRWLDEEDAEVGSFSVQILPAAEELPYLKRGTQEEGLFGSRAGMYYFRPAITGTYSLRLDEPAWIWDAQSRKISYTYGQEYTVTAGEPCFVLFAPGELSGGELGYTLKRQDGDIAFTAEAGTEELTFTGKPLCPTITVKDASSGYSLRSGEDYILYAQDDVSAGEKTVMVEGAGEYAGTASQTLSYTILPANLSDVEFPENVTYAYTGEPIYFRETGTYGTYKVTPADYQTKDTEENLTDTGEKTVTFEGKGNFTGEKQVSYTIVPYSIEQGQVQISGSLEYTGSPVIPELTVTAAGRVLEEGTDYTVEYANNTSPGEAALTVTGKGNYAGTLSGTFTILKKDIADLTVEPIADQIYDGQPKKPEVIIKNGETALVLNEDYTVSYENNTEIGEAGISVQGTGNYTGSQTVTFDIVNETVAAEGIPAQALTVNQEYAAAQQAMWYSCAGEKDELLLIWAQGAAASRVKFYTLEGSLLERSWDSPVQAAEDESLWLWNEKAGETFYLYVPEGTSFAVRESRELQPESAAEKTEAGTQLYHIALEQDCTYELFAEKAGNVSAVIEKDGKRTLNALTAAENQSWNPDAESAEDMGPAERYAVRYPLSQSGELYLLISGETGTFQISRMPAVSSITLKTGQDTYRRFDRQFFAQVSLEVTYEDGSEETVEAGARDSYGRTFAYGIADEEGHEYETDAQLAAGKYIRSAEAHAEDRAQVYQETPDGNGAFTVLPLSESYEENRIYPGNPFTPVDGTQTGETELHRLEAGRNWKYSFAAGEDIVLKEWDENGNAQEIASGRYFETEITEGVHFYEILSAETGYELVVQEKEAPAAVQNIVAIGDVNSISVSWNTASQIDTGYRLYRKAEGEADFDLLAEITDRSATLWVDRGVQKETQYTYYVTVTDGKYVESLPSELVTAATITDEQAPVITQLLPESGRINGTTVIRAVAEDNLKVAAMRLSIQEADTEEWTPLAESDTEECSFPLDTTQYADGMYRIKAEATDTTGNEASPYIRTYEIDNKGPAKVEGLTEEHTSVTVTLRWQDVADADLSFYRVEEQQTDGSWKNAGDTYSALGMNFTGLTPNTSYTYRVAAYDTLGNRGEASEEITVTTAGDTTNPVNSLLRPTEGSFANTIPVTIGGSDDYGIVSAVLQVKEDGGEWKDYESWTYETVKKSVTEEYALDVSAIPEGKIRVRAVFTDAAGNVSDTSNLSPFVEYVVDRTAPAAPQISKAYGRNGYIELVWQQGEEADLAGYQVYRSDEKEGDYGLLASGIAALNYFDTEAAEGQTWWYRITAKDQAGNESPYSEAVRAEKAKDTQAPEIVSIYPASDAVLGEDFHSISVLAGDNAGLREVKVWMAAGEDEYRELSQRALEGVQDSAVFELPIEGLAHGERLRVKAVVTDLAGNESQAAESSYLLDLEAPKVLKAAAEYLEEEDKVSLSWTGADEEDLAGYRISRKAAGEDTFRQMAQVAAEAGKMQYTWKDARPALEKITYIYLIEGIDASGNKGGIQTEAVSLPDRSMPEAVIDCESVMEQGVQYRISALNSWDNTKIVSYELDMGDGTVYRSAEAVHTYENTGTYTITLMVTDEDGNTGITEKEVEVREPKLLGTVRVRVQGTDGAPIRGASVYFDLGEPEQFIRTTESDGTAVFTAEAGAHAVGCIAGNNEYLPQKKQVTVSAGAETVLTFTMVQQPIVEGNFEIHRMTFEEIEAAGIDMEDPENQYIVKMTVHLEYGTKPYTLEWVYNPSTNKVLKFPDPVFIPDGDDDDDEEGRRLLPDIIIPNKDGNASWNLDTGDNVSIGILDVPVGTSILKEFFDVKLHIINNSGAEFSMLDNEITLHVPEGLSIVSANATESSAYVSVPEIRGGTQETINWILRGDEVGSYYLSADYYGTLSEFECPVTASFQAEEPIEVYGLSGMKLTMYVAEELKDQTLYFDLELKNEGELDAYLPDVFSDDLSQLVYQEYFDASNELVKALNQTTMKPGERLVKHYQRSAAELDETLKYLKDFYYETAGSTYGLNFEIVTQPLSYFRAAEDDVVLTFDSVGGSQVAAIKGLPKGKTFEELSQTEEFEYLKWPVPVKEGLYFAGWYESPDYQGELVDQFTVLETSMTLYAKWSKESVAEGSLSAKVGKGQYGLHFVNNAGEPQKGVKVTFDGQTGKTDEEGDVIFNRPKTETVVLKASKEGFATWINSSYILREKPYDLITLYTEGEAAYDLRMAVYNEGVRGSADLLKKKKRLIALYGEDGKIDDPAFTISCYISVGSTGDFQRMELWQSGKMIQESTSVSPEGCVVFDDLHIQDFQSGSGVFVKTEFQTPGGGMVTKKNLNLEFVASPGDFDLKLADKFSIKIDESVPLLGGMELSIDTPMFPVYITASADGTVAVGVNINKDNFNTEARKESVKDFFDSVKNMKEGLGLGLGSEELKKKISELSGKKHPEAETSIEFVGYLEGQITREGEIGKLSGHAIVTITLSKKFSWQFPIPVPVTAQVSLKGEGEGHARAGYDFAKNDWDLGLDTKLTAAVEGFIGAGLAGIAAAGGFASGSTSLSFKNVVHLQEWLATLGAGVKVYAGPFEYKWTLAEKTWYLYSANKAKAARIRAENLAELQSVEVYEYTDRSYLEEQSDWLGEDAQAEPGEVVPLLTDTYGGSQPQIVSAGDTTVMVYRGDTKEAGRDAANMGQLMYSVYENGSWRTPQPVDNNEQADVSFSLYTDGSEIYLTYQEANKVFTADVSADPASYFSALEIVTARFDKASGAFTDFEKATEEQGRYNSQPDTAVNEGRRMTVWVSNEAADLFGANSTNEIQMRITGDGSSSGIQTLQSGMNSIISLKAGVLEGAFAAAYVMDGDNNLTTMDDRILCLLNEEGEEFQLAQGTVTDLQFAQVPGVKGAALVWYQDGSVMMVRAFDETPETLIDGSEISVQSGFRMVGNYILFIGSEDESCSNVYAVAWENGTWNPPVFVTDQTQHITDISAATIDGKICLVMMQNHQSVTGEGETASEENHYTMSAVTLGEIHRLVLESAQYEKELAVPGTEIPVSFTVSNQGTSAVTSIEASVTDGQGNVLGQQTYETELPSTGEQELSLTIRVPEVLDDTEYTLAVWETGTQAGEQGQMTFRMNQTDLAVSVETSMVGRYYEAVIEVTNQGYVAAGGTLRVYASRDGELLKEEAVAVLNPEESAVYKFTQDTSELTQTEDALTIELTTDGADYDSYNNTYIDMIYQSYEVAYFVNGQTWYREFLDMGNVLTFPDEPSGTTKFLGWYPVGGEEKAVEGTEVTSSMELEARFAQPLFRVMDAQGNVTQTDDTEEVFRRLGTESGLQAVVLGEITAEQAILVAAGNSLIVSADAVLTIAEDAVLTNRGVLQADGSIICLGTLVNEESFIVNGNLENSGTLNNQGTLNNNGSLVNNKTIENSGNLYNNAALDTQNGSVNGSGLLLNAGTLTGEDNISSQISSHVHVWAGAYTTDVEATCYQQGSRSRHCTVDGCQARTDVEILGRQEHTYGEWQVIQEASATDTGIKVRSCRICGHSETQEIPNLTDAPKEMANLQVSGWKDAYDGAAHTIEITGAPEDAEVLYYTAEGGTPLEEAPACTKEGLYTIWYRISGEGWQTQEGSVQIEITACSHRFAAEFTVDTQPGETTPGSESRHCLVPGCEGRTDVTAIPATAGAYGQMQEKLGTITEDNVGTEENKELLQSYVDTVLKEESASLVAENVDMDTLFNLEAKYLASVKDESAGTSVVVETIAELTDSSGQIQQEAALKIEGGAFTAARAAAQISGESEVASKLTLQTLSASQVADAELRERLEAGDAVALDISLSVVNARTGDALEGCEDMQPAAPLRITIPVPEILTERQELILIHQKDDGTEENLSYTVDERNHTITFTVTSLSCFILSGGECTEHQYTVTLSEQAATCVPGWVQKRCRFCETSVTEELPAAGGHQGGEADCLHRAVCETCGQEYGEPGSHKGGTATCQEQAVCEICNEAYGELGAHSYSTQWTVSKEPTCAENGSKYRACTVEGCTAITEETAIPALGHTGGTATCQKQAVCSRCGQEYGELGAHKGGTATCQKQAVCSQCGQPYGALGGHNFSTAWSTDRNPTCTANGSKSHHCMTPGCTAKTGDTAIPALGHSWGAYVRTKNPTALQEGTDTKTCSRCGQKESRAVAKLTPYIAVSASSIRLQTRQSTTKLKVTGMAEGDYVASWKSSNTKIVKVSQSGKLTAQKKAGKATVTITLKSGLEKKISVTVQTKKVTTTKISGLKKKITIQKGKTASLNPVITPLTSQDTVKYTTSNKKVATVTSKGTVKAVGSGTAKITIRSGSKKTTVTVTVPKVKTEKITGVPAAKTLKRKKSFTLKPKLTPKDSSYKITYKSSNKKVATVTAKGKVTAKAKGTAIITVKSGTVSVRCKVTVK